MIQTYLWKFLLTSTINSVAIVSSFAVPFPDTSRGNQLSLNPTCKKEFRPRSQVPTGIRTMSPKYVVPPQKEVFSSFALGVLGI
jgi:hypothetical protein